MLSLPFFLKQTGTAVTKMTVDQPADCRPTFVSNMGVSISDNTLLHLLGTGLSRSYSPGLFSGLLFYLPLGGVALGRGLRRLGTTAVRRGIVVGVVIHALVPVVGILLAGLLRVGG